MFMKYFFLPPLCIHDYLLSAAYFATMEGKPTEHPEVITVPTEPEDYLFEIDPIVSYDQYVWKIYQMRWPIGYNAGQPHSGPKEIFSMAYVYVSRKFGCNLCVQYCPWHPRYAVSQVRGYEYLRYLNKSEACWQFPI